MSTDEYKNKGNDAFKAKQYKTAIDLYTKALDTKPANETCGALYSNRAACWQALGDYAAALRDAEACVRARPDWLKGHYRKGVALESLKRLDDAQRAYQDALKVEPGNDETKDRLHAINTQLAKRNESTRPSQCTTPEEAKVIGNSLFSAGKYDLAATFYSRAIELQPTPSKEKAVYYTNRAACYQQTHLYAQMVDDCNAALAIDETQVKAYLRRAIAYEGMERWKAALDDYNRAKELAPSTPAISQGILRCQRALRA